MTNGFYKVCTIRLAGESISGKMSVGTLLYVYHVDSNTLDRQLMDFIDNSILDSVCKLYPQSLLNRDEFYSKEQLAAAFGRYSIYMEKAGSLDDLYSPFNKIELRYPLKMEAQDEPFVKALSEFKAKAMVKLEDIL